jgi:hypothetical protein
MYPGTYQPLQAMSLLLADLLNYPHSDEAPTSQGLVDAIFDLYQVDHGMMTGTDPPRRKLSPSGREAWSMLGRLRSKALEQMDQDPHVVLPSFIASSHLCVCGERIAHEAILSEAPAQPDLPPWDPELESEMALAARQDTPMAESMPGQMGFDWDEWDAYLGSATGTMI